MDGATGSGTGQMKMALASRGSPRKKRILAEANLGQAVDFVWVSRPVPAVWEFCLAPAFLIPALLLQSVRS